MLPCNVMLMSSEQISYFRQYLEFMGFEEGEHYDVSGAGEELQFTVRIATDRRPLPEELKPFSPSPQREEEMSHNGNCEKSTFEGIHFELALRGWAEDKMNAHPELSALPPAETVKDLEEFARRRELRTKIWQEVTHRPEFLAWEKELEEKYY